MHEKTCTAKTLTNTCSFYLHRHQSPMRLQLIHTRYAMYYRHTQLIHVHVVHSYKTCTTISYFQFIYPTHLHTKDGGFNPRQRKTLQKVEVVFPPNQSIQSDIQWLELLNVHEKTYNKPKGSRILLSLRSSDR